MKSFGPEILHILVVHDACPERSGNAKLNQFRDKRAQTSFHTIIQSVGGAIINEYKRASGLQSDIANFAKKGFCLEP